MNPPPSPSRAWGRDQHYNGLPCQSTRGHTRHLSFSCSLSRLTRQTKSVRMERMATLHGNPLSITWWYYYPRRWPAYPYSPKGRSKSTEAKARRGSTPDGPPHSCSPAVYSRRVCRPNRKRSLVSASTILRASEGGPKLLFFIPLNQRTKLLFFYPSRCCCYARSAYRHNPCTWWGRVIHTIRGHRSCKLKEASLLFARKHDAA